MKISSLETFFQFLEKVTAEKRLIVARFSELNGKDKNEYAELFSTYLDTLNNSNFENLMIDNQSNIALNIDYERAEFYKDWLFLSSSESDFFVYLNEIHFNFNEQYLNGIQFLENSTFDYLFTDRDGTLNNDSVRYNTAAQSVFSGVFFSRFSEKLSQQSIIVTSSPLKSIGLVDLSVNSSSKIIYAGANGKEIVDATGENYFYPMQEESKLLFDAFNQEVEKLLDNQAYQKFRWIDSGVQKKWGHTSIATNNNQGSISSKEAKSFSAIIYDILNRIDADRNHFNIRKSQFKIDIFLKKEEANYQKKFTKESGVLFIKDVLNVDLTDKNILILGNSSSDVDMIKACKQFTPNIKTIFVTRNEILKNEVMALCPNCFFVTEPDILIAILGHCNP